MKGVFSSVTLIILFGFLFAGTCIYCELRCTHLHHRKMMVRWNRSLYMHQLYAIVIYTLSKKADNYKRGVIALFKRSLSAVHSREERLWCYECNTDLRQGHKGDCNDPYTPGASDLVACPRNESHHCHKSIVLCACILYNIYTLSQFFLLYY